MADDDPVVVGANRYRFSPGEHIVNPHVMSVSFIWVLSGGGEIVAGGKRFRVDSQHVVRLPWHHAVEYRADQRGPFHVGTLHVVPRHARVAQVIPRVAHLRGDPLLLDPARSGDASAFLPGISSTRNSAARRIVEFGTIAIERLGEDAFDEEYFRALGRLVLIENASWAAGHAHQSTLPGSLELMMTFVRHHIAEPLTVARVAESARCSETTAQRLFARHVGESIQSWIRRMRLREAAALLRTTGLRVSEVAQLVGYSDPLYFSRAFRRAYGVAPSRFAQTELRP
jgi:AraC-like DNA-binding protein